MRLLLDTHIWLWYSLGSSQLSNNLKNLIEDENNELWLSAFSVWEAQILGEKGKITLTPSPSVWIKNQLNLLQCKEPEFNSRIALLSRELEFKHKDPIDRFIASQAQAFDLTFATADKVLLELEWLRCVS